MGQDPNPIWEYAGITVGIVLIVRAILYWWSYKE